MAVVIAVIAVVVAFLVHDNTTSSTGSTPKIDEGLAPQPARRFIRVGTTDGSQFTDSQFNYLAQNFDYVLLTKTHTAYNPQGWHDATKRLVALNPSIKVMPYVNTKYWFDQNDWGVNFNPAWFLRDNNGQVIKRTTKTQGEQDFATFIDLSNPDYRNWILSVMADWLDAAPYAGISFDEAAPIGTSNDNVDFESRLGQQRIDAYNAGIRDLLTRTTQLAGPNREVIFNGIDPGSPSQNVQLLQYTTGALSEYFCLGPQGRVEDLSTTWDTMNTIPTDKKLFLRTNFPAHTSDSLRARYERLCTGAFLMAWHPGVDYFQMGDDYTDKQLDNDPQILSLAVGNPSGDMQTKGSITTRRFSNGWVAVNTGRSSASVVTPTDGVSLAGSDGAVTVHAGQTMSVPADDAVFVVENVGPVNTAAK